MSEVQNTSRTIPFWSKAIILAACLFALLGITGIATMSNSGSVASPIAASASSSQPQLFAQDTGGSTAVKLCPESDGDASQAMRSLKSELLPALRWDNIELTAYSSTDGSDIMATINNAMTTIANMFFSLGGVLWKAFFSVLSWGLLFQPLCTVAPQVNSMAAMFGVYATALLIPATLFTFYRQRQHIFRAGGVKVMSSLMTVLILFGTIFYILDATGKANQSGGDASTVINTKGTLPWMASKVIVLVNSMSTSFSYVSNYANERISDAKTTAFLDTESVMNRSRTSKTAFTCNKYDEHLYQEYQERAKEKAGPVPGATTAMEQMSRIWEVTYLTSYINAQYGRAENNSTLPYNLACWRLERMNAANETPEDRANLFVNAFKGTPGMPTGTEELEKSGFIYLLYPGMGDYQSKLADAFWAICGNFKDGKLQLGENLSGTAVGTDAHCAPEQEGDAGPPFGPDGLKNAPKEGNGTPQETMKGILETGRKDENCFFCIDLGITKIKLAKIDGKDGLYTFDQGGKSIENKFAKAEDDSQVDEGALNLYRNWASAWIGNGIGSRIMNGLLALMVSVAYVWSMAPVAMGLPIAGVLLVVALPFIPLALALMAMGIELGKRALKVVLAACGATFLFGVMVTALASMNSVMTSMAMKVLGENLGSFFGQIILGFMPIAALLLLRKGAQALQLGDLTKFSGGLGMASGMVAAAAGEGRAFDRATNSVKRGGGSALAGAMGGLALADRMRGRHNRRKEDGQPSLLNRAANTALGRRIAESQVVKGAQGLKKGAAAMAKEKIGNTAHHTKGLAEKGKNALLGAAMKNKPLRNFANSPLGKRLGQNKQLPVVAKAAAATSLGAMMGTPLGALAAGGYLTAKGLNGKFGKSNLSLMQRAEQFGASRQEKLASAKSKWAGTNRRITNRDLEDTVGAVTKVEDMQIITTLGKGKSVEQIKQTQSIHANIEQFRSPKEKATIRASEATNALSGLLGHQFGGRSKDGFNSEFNGIITETEFQLTRNAMAQATGIPEKEWTVSVAGLAATKPILKRKDGLPILSNPSVESYAAPEAWVPTSISEPRMNDREGEREARVTGYMVAQGWVDPYTNRKVDMLDMMGYDVNDSGDRSTIMSIANGEMQLPPAARRKISTELTPSAASMAESFVQSALSFTEIPKARRQNFVEDLAASIEDARESVSGLSETKIIAKQVNSGNPFSDSIATPLEFAPTLTTLSSDLNSLTGVLQDMREAIETRSDSDSKRITREDRDQAVNAMRDVMNTATTTAEGAQAALLDIVASEGLLRQATGAMDPTLNDDENAQATRRALAEMNEKQQDIARKFTELQNQIEATLSEASAAPPRVLLDKLDTLIGLSEELNGVSDDMVGNRLRTAKESLENYAAARQALEDEQERAQNEQNRTGHAAPSALPRRGN